MDIIKKDKILRESIVDQTKKVIAELNDTSEMRKRIQENKKKHNSEILNNEDPLKKTAKPSADSTL